MAPTLDTTTACAYAALTSSLRDLRFEGLPQDAADAIAAAAEARLFDEDDVEERTVAGYAALRRLESCPWLDIRSVRALRNQLLTIRSVRRTELLTANLESRLAAIGV
jgi:hypothetical protein